MSQLNVEKRDKTDFGEIVVDLDFEDVAYMLERIFEMDLEDGEINKVHYPFISIRHFHRRLAFLVREMTGIEVIPTELRHGNNLITDRPIKIYRGTNIDKLTELMLTLGLLECKEIVPDKYAPNDPRSNFATTRPVKHYKIIHKP